MTLACKPLDFPQPRHGDWAGSTVVIVASGRSAAEAPLEMLRDRARFVTINSSWRLAPWADVAFACDWQFWARSEYAPAPGEFDGARVYGVAPVGRQIKELTAGEKQRLRGLVMMKIRHGYGPLVWTEPEIRGGGSSTVQALNAIVRQGVKRILLVGVDCDAPEKRWHGRHTHKGASIQRENTLRDWREQWLLIAPDLRRRNIEVINCSLASKVTAFPIMSLTEAAKLL